MYKQRKNPFNTPVLKVDMEDGVLGKANKDGTIHINKDVTDPKQEQEIIEHESVHLDQMERGDLDYTDDKVIWKGKEYSRKNMKEGSKKLPWEKEVYDKTGEDSPLNKNGGIKEKIKKWKQNRGWKETAQSKPFTVRNKEDYIKQAKESKTGVFTPKVSTQADKDWLASENVKQQKKQISTGYVGSSQLADRINISTPPKSESDASSTIGKVPTEDYGKAMSHEDFVKDVFNVETTQYKNPTSDDLASAKSAGVLKPSSYNYYDKIQDPDMPLARENRYSTNYEYQKEKVVPTDFSGTTGRESTPQLTGRRMKWGGGRHSSHRSAIGGGKAKTKIAKTFLPKSKTIYTTDDITGVESSKKVWNRKKYDTSKEYFDTYNRRTGSHSKIDQAQYDETRARINQQQVANRTYNTNLQQNIADLRSGLFSD